LIGYSSDTNVSLADVKFNDGSTEYTWDNAVSNSKVRAYLAYYDSSESNASQRKFKYVSTVSGADDTELRKGKGYWLYSNQSGNLTLPAVGGSTSGQTYDWSQLRFANSSGSEMNVTDADVAGWIFGGTGAQTYINYWDPNEGATGGWDEVSEGVNADKSTLSSWEGYFIYSNVDNLTLIRQN